MITGTGITETNKTNGVQYLLKSLSEEGSNEDQDWKPEIPFGNVRKTNGGRATIHYTFQQAMNSLQ